MNHLPLIWQGPRGLQVKPVSFKFLAFKCSVELSGNSVQSEEMNQWTTHELKFLRSLKSPVGIQKFLDSIPYHLASTAWSPRRVLQGQSAHCLEGAIFAAAALQVLGYPPLILDLEAEQDSDHVIAVYQSSGGWGAIASSNYSGCRFRSPIYRNFRELALSYFESYFNLRGDRSLRRFSRPVNLNRFNHKNWTTTEAPVWFIAEYLLDIPHQPLLKKAMLKNLTRVDQRSLAAGFLGLRKKR